MYTKGTPTLSSKIYHFQASQVNLQRRIDLKHLTTQVKIWGIKVLGLRQFSNPSKLLAFLSPNIPHETVRDCVPNLYIAASTKSASQLINGPLDYVVLPNEAQLFQVQWVYYCKHTVLF